MCWKTCVISHQIIHRMNNDNLTELNKKIRFLQTQPSTSSSSAYAMYWDAAQRPDCFLQEREKSVAATAAAMGVGGGSHERSCLATLQTMSNQFVHIHPGHTQSQKLENSLWASKYFKANNSPLCEFILDAKIASRLILTLHLVQSAARALTHKHVYIK